MNVTHPDPEDRFPPSRRPTVWQLAKASIATIALTMSTWSNRLTDCNPQTVEDAGYTCNGTGAWRPREMRRANWPTTLVMPPKKACCLTHSLATYTHCEASLIGSSFPCLRLGALYSFTEFQ